MYQDSEVVGYIVYGVRIYRDMTGDARFASSHSFWESRVWDGVSTFRDGFPQINHAGNTFTDEPCSLYPVHSKSSQIDCEN